MPPSNNFVNAGAAGERLFRLYHVYCTAPGPDALFSLLQAGHSLRDRLVRDTRFDLIDIPEFLALKCLRNYFHHQQEIQHALKVIPLGNHPINSDLAIMCLVRGDVVDTAIQGVAARHRGGTRIACQAVFHWYGSVVNINPCVFNFGVLVFEYLKKAGVSLTGDAVQMFEESYRYEEENELSHLIDGTLYASAGNLGELLAGIMATEGLEPHCGASD